MLSSIIWLGCILFWLSGDLCGKTGKVLPQTKVSLLNGQPPATIQNNWAKRKKKKGKLLSLVVLAGFVGLSFGLFPIFPGVLCFFFLFFVLFCDCKQASSTYQRYSCRWQLLEHYLTFIVQNNFVYLFSMLFFCLVCYVGNVCDTGQSQFAAAGLFVILIRNSQRQK